MRKNVFVDKHEQFDVVKDCRNFLIKIEKLKLYIVKFEENGIMKSKAYLFNCTIRRNKHQFIIVITHNKYIFFTNDRIWRAWI